MKKLSLLLFEPAQTILLAPERRRVRVLSVLSIVLIGLSLAGLIFGAPVLVTFLAFVLGYGLTRTRHYRIGVLVILFGIYNSSFSILSAPPGAWSSLTAAYLWLSLGLILGGGWLSPSGSLINTLFLMLNLLVVFLINPALAANSPASLLSIESIVFIFGLLVTLNNWLNRLDQHELAEAHQQALQSGAELHKYFLAIEQSGNAIVITDPQGRIEYVNPAFVILTGYSLAEARGKNPRILKSGFHSPEFYAQMWKTIGAGETWHGELQNKRKDGSLFWESTTIAPIQNQAGEIANFVAIKEDISAAKELQQRLEQQNKFLSILHQTTIELLNRQELADLLNTIVERACLLLDAPLGEIMLKEGEVMVVRAFTKNQPYLIGDKVDRTQAKLTWRAHDTGEPVVLEDYLKWSGHRDIYDENPLHAIADFPIMVGNNCIGVLAMGRTLENYPFSPEQVETGLLFARLASLVLDNASLYDSALKEIEQRKLAEDRNLRFLDDMKSLQEIYLTLSQVDQLEDLYAQMIDLTQRRLGLDRVGLFIFDETTNEIVGTFGVSPSGQIRDERYYREFVTENHWTQEIVNAHNHTIQWENAPLLYDGREIGLGWKVATTLWNGTQAIGYLVCDTFLTRRPARSYESELVSLLGNTFGHLLERKRAEQQLAIARDQALEASRFKSQLLAKISHELRTPLGAAIGYAELLQNNFYGPLSAEQQDAVGNIMDSGHYLNLMINELLDQAQIEAKSVKLQLAPFAPADLLTHLMSIVSVLAEKKALACHSSVDPDLPEILYGDSKRIQQILINLTGNAIKFTMAGEVRVDFQRSEAGFWALRVSDTGVGIPQEAQASIFEPFRQMDNAITNQNRGVGLGLSITKQLVELMGGRISLESEIGRGSVFTILLPLVEAEVGKSSKTI